MANIKLHCIGDSHTSFFTGYNKINIEFPGIGKSIVKSILTYRIGAPLAYNLCELSSKEKSHEKLFSILDTLETENDYILFCFGEIDCRAHILKQAELKSREIHAVVEECALRYLSTILEVKRKGFKVGVWNVIPTAIGIENPDSEFPYFGNFEQRNQAAIFFNHFLQKYSVENNFEFINIFHKLIGKSLLTKQQYYFDKIHLNSKALPFALQIIKNKVKGFKFTNTEIIKIRLQFLLDFFRKND